MQSVSLISLIFSLFALFLTPLLLRYQHRRFCCLAFFHVLPYTVLTGHCHDQVQMKGTSVTMDFNKDLHESILDACMDDSYKVIKYLKEQEQRQKPYNLTMLIFTIVSATGAVIAAVTGLLMYFQ